MFCVPSHETFVTLFIHFAIKLFGLRYKLIFQYL